MSNGTLTNGSLPNGMLNGTSATVTVTQSYTSYVSDPPTSTEPPSSADVSIWRPPSDLQRTYTPSATAAAAAVGSAVGSAGLSQYESLQSVQFFPIELTNSDYKCRVYRLLARGICRRVSELARSLPPSLPPTPPESLSESLSESPFPSQSPHHYHHDSAQESTAGRGSIVSMDREIKENKEQQQPEQYERPSYQPQEQTGSRCDLPYLLRAVLGLPQSTMRLQVEKNAIISQQEHSETVRAHFVSALGCEYSDLIMPAEFILHHILKFFDFEEEEEDLSEHGRLSSDLGGVIEASRDLLLCFQADQANDLAVSIDRLPGDSLQGDSGSGLRTVLEASASMIAASKALDQLNALSRQLQTHSVFKQWRMGALKWSWTPGADATSLTH